MDYSPSECGFSQTRFRPFVVQDADYYQKLLDKVKEAEDLEAVREGLAQPLAGLGRPAEEFFSEFERKRGLRSGTRSELRPEDIE